MTASAEVT